MTSSHDSDTPNGVESTVSDEETAFRRQLASIIADSDLPPRAQAVLLHQQAEKVSTQADIRDLEPPYHDFIASTDAPHARMRSIDFDPEGLGGIEDYDHDHGHGNGHDHE